MKLLDDKNFYPTPRHLIEKMLAECNKDLISTVLEPSAGKGDIAEYVKEWLGYRRDDLDCIEINPTLQATLRGKGLRVVHDDFLTYRTQKRYDLIIMNPPFDNGDKHLLKALELQANGGAVICLLNAETLKNPHTNTRIELARRLGELNAGVEYIENAFADADAERKTNVEVALVKALIPQKEFSSAIFESMQKAMAYEEVEVTEEQRDALIHADFMEYLKALIHQYHVEVSAGVGLIREHNAMKPLMLESLKKPKYGYDHRDPIIELRVKGKSGGNLVNELIAAVRIKYWRFLFDNEVFVGKLTSNLRNHYDGMVDRMRDYEFSVYNVLIVKDDMQKCLVKGVEETILALFDELSRKHHYHDETSGNVHYYNGWKTNKAWKINSKVIIPFYLFRDYGHFNTYDACSKMRDMTKVFDYLDCGQTKYAYDISNTVEFALGHGQTKNIELKYFDVTFFKKGTCHIKFKNAELLEKFNLYGSQKKGWLPPGYGKKAYSDMADEEKEVVKEFSGNVESYHKIFTNQQYYIINEQLMIEA